MKRSFSNYALIGLKGIAMGSADVVPGVSGGTIAFITGIYDELVDSIRNSVPAIKQFFTGKKTLKQRIVDFWTTLNGNFLVALLFGIALAMGLLANVITYALENYPILVNAFFCGLIIASIVLLYKKIPKWTWNCILFGVVGIGLALLLPESTTIDNSPSEVPLGYLFVCACISICAMILPGISGSFVLVLLGAYKAFITAIDELNLLYLAVFGAGAAIGLIAFSSVLSWLLKKYHNLTVALLTGFIVGSLNIIWPWKAAGHNVLPKVYETQAATSPMLIEAIIACIAGLVLVLGIELVAKQFSKKSKIQPA